MISEVLPYVLMITCILIRVSSKEVKWTVHDTSPKLGQGLTLFCEVDNCFANETKRWHGGPDYKLLMVNSGISTDKAKYNTSIENNGFILTILNLTVKDLNVSYECSCGLDNDKHILYIEDVYTVDNLNKSTNGTNSVAANDGSGKSLIITLAIILIISTLLIVVLIVVMKKKLGGYKDSYKDEDNIRNVGDSLFPPVAKGAFLRRHSSGATYYSDEDNIQNVGDSLLPPVAKDALLRRHSSGATFYSAKSSIESTSCDETSSAASTHAVKNRPRYVYRNIKLREKSFKTWPLNVPTIEQLAEAGFFHSGHTNIAQCFSCGNSIHWKEGQDPLDEKLHINCAYLRQITSNTQLKTACSPDQ